MKTTLTLGSLLAILIIGGSCKKQTCASCIAQNNVSMEVVETRTACDKKPGYANGFVEGFNQRYADSSHINVVCSVD